MNDEKLLAAIREWQTNPQNDVLRVRGEAVWYAAMTLEAAPASTRGGGAGAG